MANNIENAYYEESINGNVQYTNVPTPYPVDPGALFYQEKQKKGGGQCGIHTLAAYRGSSLSEKDKNQLVKLNNKIQSAAALKIGVDPNLLGQLKKIDDLDEPGNGLSENVVHAYIEKNKKKFHIPEESIILLNMGKLKSEPIQKEMERLKTDKHLHRAILGINGQHYLCLRKDLDGKWRCIDSKSISHKITEENIIDVQPKFPTVTQAIKHVAKSYQGDGIIIIAPTLDRDKEATDCSCTIL